MAHNGYTICRAQRLYLPRPNSMTCHENCQAPDNARDVICQGSYCATVCNQGKYVFSTHRISELSLVVRPFLSNVVFQGCA